MNGTTMSNAVTTSLRPTTVAIAVAQCFVDDSLATRAGRILVYGLIIVLSLVANSLVVTIVLKDKKLKKPINFFIINMCCADLLITVVYMPRVVAIFAVGYEWLLHGTVGLIACKLVFFIYESSVTVSILTVVVISVERFILLVFPLKRIITNRLSLYIVASIWVIAVAFRFPVAYAITLKQSRNKTYCNAKLDEQFGIGAEKRYYQVILVLLYSVPLAAIVVLYSAIIVNLKKRKVPGSGLARREENREEERNRRVLRMVLIVVAVFVFSWMLYFIVLVLYSYSVVVPCELRFARLFLAHSNSAITPCLYFTFSENFRNGLKSMVRKYCVCCYCCFQSPSDSNQEMMLANNQEITVERHKNNSTENVHLKLYNKT